MVTLKNIYQLLDESPADSRAETACFPEALGTIGLTLGLSACGGGDNSDSGPATVAVGGAKPSDSTTPPFAAPVSVLAKASNSRVELSWTPLATASSYEVRRSIGSGGPYDLVGSTSATSWTDTGVVNGLSFFYTVTAVNSTGNRVSSSAVNAVPLEPEPTRAPDVPTGISVTPGNARISLVWAAVAGATNYQVKRSRAATGPFVLVGNLVTPAFTDTGIINGGAYFYVVSALNLIGASPDSSPVSGTPTPLSIQPTSPTGLAAVAGDTRISLSWVGSAAATAYQVKRATNGAGPFNLVGSPSDTSFTDVGLTNGVKYFYIVAATNGALISPDSLQTSATPKSTATAAAPVSAAEAARFLLQAQFSASDAEIVAVRSKGYRTWLNEQFASPTSTTGFAWLESRGYGVVESVYRYNDTSYQGDYMIWNQLMTSSDAVRKRCALALSEFFVVSLTGLNFGWPSHAIAAWWDILVEHAFGNYRQLLEAVTLNPAMGYFLNTKGNKKEDVARNRVPDENYGREVMQLFSLGLYQLNPDGTEKRDGGGNRIETYTQSDITNIARVFTGWDFDQSQNVPVFEPVQSRTVPSVHYTRLPMALTATNHSNLAATFLGTTVPAGTAGVPALKIVLDALFAHPNVPPFFGKQMIQRLVTSNPSPAYVARVSAAFSDNGAGVRGDLKAVFAAVLLDDEARSASGLSQPGFGKLREPMLRLVQWGRTFGITSARGSWKIGNLSNPGNQLGQSPLRSPSVFNFFRPGYVPPGTALSASKTPAPEFQLVNESGVGGYLNYMQGVIRSGIYVSAPDQAGSGSNASNGYDITASYTAELALVLDTTALVARLNLLLCAGQLSSATETLIINALNATALTVASSDGAKRDRVAAAVLLIMASSEYLIQK